MCLAVPARIERIRGKHASVDFGGLKRDIKIIMTPGVKVNDYVLVHAGFSIQKIDKKQAAESLKVWSAIR